MPDDFAVQLLNLVRDQNSNLRKDVREGFATQAKATDALAAEVRELLLVMRNLDRRNLSLVKSIWNTLKVPITQLVLALAAYLGWQQLGLPPTPTPVHVEVQP